MGTIRVECPHCQSYCDAPSRLSGQTARCPKCNEILQVPIPTARQVSKESLQSSSDSSPGKDVEPPPFVVIDHPVYQPPATKRRRQLAVLIRNFVYLAMTVGLTFASYAYIQHRLQSIEDSYKSQRQAVASPSPPQDVGFRAEATQRPASEVSQEEDTVADTTSRSASIIGSISQQEPIPLIEMPVPEVTGWGNDFNLLAANAVETTVIDGRLVYKWNVIIKSLNHTEMVLSMHVSLVDKGGMALGKSSESRLSFRPTQTCEISGLIDIDPSNSKDVDAVLAVVRAML